MDVTNLKSCYYAIIFGCIHILYFWLTKPHNTCVGEYCIALLSYFVYNSASMINAENNKNKGIKGEITKNDKERNDH